VNECEVINGVRIPNGFLLLEPRNHLDQAITGVDDVVLYDMSTLIDGFIESGMSYEEAMEWISYNTDSNDRFFGPDYPNTPKIINCEEWNEHEDEE
jgi:hypothetical protein